MHFFKTVLWSLKFQVLTYHTDYRSGDTAALRGRSYNGLSKQNILNSGLYTQELQKQITPYWDCDRKDITRFINLINITTHHY